MREITFKSFGEVCTVKFDDSPEVVKAVFEKLITDYYCKHQSFKGESIMQSDNPQIEAPVILSEIADDILKFYVEWHEAPDAKG